MFGPTGVLPTTTTGAIGELMVAAALLKDGWDVYRSLSPSAQCDLIARKGGRTLCIEVRSARRNGLGKLVCNKPPQGTRQFDTLAMVLPSGEIAYRGEYPTPEDAEGRSSP